MKSGLSSTLLECLPVLAQCQGALFCRAGQSVPRATTSATRGGAKHQSVEDGPCRIHAGSTRAMAAPRPGRAEATVSEVRTSERIRLHASYALHGRGRRTLLVHTSLSLVKYTCPPTILSLGNHATSPVVSAIMLLRRRV